jgi:hypothetical protein
MENVTERGDGQVVDHLIINEIELIQKNHQL